MRVKQIPCIPVTFYWEQAETDIYMGSQLDRVCRMNPATWDCLRTHARWKRCYMHDFLRLPKLCRDVNASFITQRTATIRRSGFALVFFSQDENRVITPLNLMLRTKAVSHHWQQAHTDGSSVCRQRHTDREILER